MKKVSVVFDGENHSTGAYRFARELQERSPIMLVGSFLQGNDFISLPNPASVAGTAPYPDGSGTAPGKVCAKNCLKCQLRHPARETGFEGLVQVNRFSDALIISQELLFKNMDHTRPCGYLQGLLRSAECPVLLVPGRATFPETIVLAYDGSVSCLSALEQFVALFPGLCNLKTLLVYVGPEGSGLLPDGPIHALAAKHFSNWSVVAAPAVGSRAFGTWMSGVSHPFVVCGTSGRFRLQELVQRSFAADVIQGNHAILFIAPIVVLEKVSVR